MDRGAIKDGLRADDFSGTIRVGDGELHSPGDNGDDDFLSLNNRPLTIFGLFVNMPP